MNHTLTLFKPRLWSIRNRTKGKLKKGRALSVCLFGFIGLCVWGGIFVASLRILYYFNSIEQLGELISLKLLSMILITVFSLMIFSSIITCLSKLYLSKDLSLVHSMPVASFKIFFTRWVESTFDSSWMVLIYTLPVMLAYGIVYDIGLSFYLMITHEYCYMKIEILIKLNIIYSFFSQIYKDKIGNSFFQSHTFDERSISLIVFLQNSSQSFIFFHLNISSIDGSQNCARYSIAISSRSISIFIAD